jgi:ferredoxin-NADP reductase
MVEGPIGKLKYHGFGKFVMNSSTLPIKKNVGLLAAGSGITPMLSIAQASCLAEDGLNIKFVYSNKTKNDIMCSDILDELS